MNATDFEFFARFLRDRSGISLDTSKEYLVEARIGPLASELGFGGVDALVEKLRSGADSQLAKRVVDTMTTNETSFFRDLNPFEALKSEVIPRLLEERESERKLQIWSAACSTGQEPYSIAMVLRENFPELAGWTVSIVATDLSAAVLEQARSGSYSQLEVNRGMPAPLLAKYFTRQGVRWQVSDELRTWVEFRELNLLDSFASLPPADIVFLRNVLIYFEIERKRDILGRIRQVMNPDSYLFLGGAESTLNVDDRFERVDPARAGCYRLKEG